MNDVAKYLHKVSACLPGSKKQKVWILEQIREEINNSLPEGEYADIVERWGTPEELAATQIETMAPLEIAQKLRIQNWIKRWFLIVAACIILLLTGLVIAAYLDAHVGAHGTLIKDPVVIVDDIKNEETEED